MQFPMGAMKALVSTFVMKSSEEKLRSSLEDALLMVKECLGETNAVEHE